MTAKPIRIFACESQPVVIEGLRTALESCPDFQLVGVAPSAAETLAAVAAEPPEIVLIDHDDSPRAAVTLMNEIAERDLPSQPVLWARDLAEVDATRALQSGVRGIISKTHPVSELFACLGSVAAGGLWIDEAYARDLPPRPDRKSPPRLTPRERQIVALVSRGMKNAEIARELSISPGTVKVHLMHVFEKTGAMDRFELAVRSRKLLGTDSPPRGAVAGVE